MGFSAIVVVPVHTHYFNSSKTRSESIDSSVIVHELDSAIKHDFMVFWKADI